MFSGASTETLPAAFRDAETIHHQDVVFPYDAGILTPPIMTALMSGEYEREEAAQIPTIVRPDDRVLEIGSGIGFISTLISRKEPARLICVEANPHLTRYIRNVHAMNGVEGAEILNVILTNETEAAKTFYLRQDFWMSSLEPAPNSYVSTVPVPTLGLDDILRKEAISLIVCDVEGAEQHLFRGADLSGVDRIYMELHDHLIGLHGVRQACMTLERQGFAYDPRHSFGSVVLFQKAREGDPLRPYGG